MGDNRVYGTCCSLCIREPSLTWIAGYIIILRAVTTTDFMTAEAYEFDFALLRKISTRIVNEVDGVSRVTYDITSKPPGMWR